MTRATTECFVFFLRQPARLLSVGGGLDTGVKVAGGMVPAMLLGAVAVWRAPVAGLLAVEQHT